MNVSDRNKIKTLSEKFRQAILRCDRSELPYSFDNFPANSCSEASRLLGTYLKDNGFGDFNFVKGKRGHGDTLETHYWLQKDNVIVDITANQFNGIDAVVLITNMDSALHNSFDQEIIEQADYRLIEAIDIRNHLGAVYDYILQQEI